MQYQKECIKKLVENSNKIITLCNSLQNSADYETVYDFRVKIPQIETLILDSYAKARRLMPDTIQPHVMVDHYQNSYEKYVEIFEMSKECIHFRIPLLPSKRGYKNNKMCDDIIKYVFLSAMGNGIEIPQMLKHTIEFTHVWPTENRGHILDNDNYNTRSAINNIVHFIGSSDSGVNSWQIHKTILSDDMEMGTYIRVTSRDK